MVDFYFIFIPSPICSVMVSDCDVKSLIMICQQGNRGVVP